MRKWLKVIIPAVLAAFALLMMFRVIKGYTARREAFSRIQTLPDARFASLNGDMVSLTDFDYTKPMVIKYFHPECEYCRYEAREMASQASAFSQVQVVMITPDDSVQRVSRFIAEHNLLEIDNIEFLTDRNNQFRSVFGKAVIPSVYIYGPDQKLYGQFQGETRPEAILDVIYAILKVNEDTLIINTN
jgi:peroxiredoxin